MHGIKGIAAGFIAGLAFMAGAVLLMPADHGADSAPSAELAALGAQVQGLEQSVSQLSGLITSQGLSSTAGVAQAAPAQPQAAEVAKTAPTPAQIQAVAEADGMVDRGIQSGQWTRTQSSELHAAIAELDEAEGGRILARVSAAINAGELQPELP